jgi:hypothetical protein
MAALVAAVPALDDNEDALKALENTQFSDNPQVTVTMQCVIERGVVIQGIL